MDYVLQNLRQLGFEPFSSISRFFWVYCLSSFLIAACLYVTRQAKYEGFRLRRLIAFCFPGEIYRHPSAVVDYKLLLVNAVLSPATALFSVFSVTLMSAWVSDALTGAFGPATAKAECAGWGMLAYSAGSMFVRELCIYVGHLLSHRVPVLWEFHKVHHSAEVLTPFTAERKHPVSILVLMGTAVVGLGAYQGVMVYAVFGTVALTTLFGVELFLGLSLLAGTHLRHSHIPLGFGRRLSHVFMSPAQHRVHHSARPEHWNSNFGETLSIFDWMFGTLYIPNGQEHLTFGVDLAKQSHDGVLRAYAHPFAAAWRVLTGDFAHRGSRSPEPPGSYSR